MSAREKDRTPPALAPYLQLPPESSLLLLTNTLNCTASWLVAHLIHNVLHPPNDGSNTTPQTHPNGVVLISWLRDFTFWKNEIRRLTGLDLTRAQQTKTFSFLPILTTPSTPADLASTLQTTLATLHPTRILLILDHPILTLLDPSAPDLTRTLLSLRSHVHATAITQPADAAFLQPAADATTAPTPFDARVAAALTTQAHAAWVTIGVRGLPSGAARDVSGVVRVTRGERFEGEGEGEGERGEVLPEEGEWLYLVQRDGGVRVFRRGEGVGG